MVLSSSFLKKSLAILPGSMVYFFKRAMSSSFTVVADHYSNNSVSKWYAECSENCFRSFRFTLHDQYKYCESRKHFGISREFMHLFWINITNDSQCLKEHVSVLSLYSIRFSLYFSDPTESLQRSQTMRVWVIISFFWGLDIFGYLSDFYRMVNGKHDKVTNRLLMRLVSINMNR